MCTNTKQSCEQDIVQIIIKKRGPFYLPGHRHGKLFIGRPCKKIADDLLKLSRHQLKTVAAILTGHAPVRRHLYIMGLFDGDPTC